MVMRRSKGALAVSPDQEWRARQDMSTLREAEEIRRDAKRLEAATAQAQKHMEELNRVKKLKPVKATAPRRNTPRKG